MRKIVPWTAAVIALVVAAVGSLSYRHSAMREAIAQEQGAMEAARAMAPPAEVGELQRDLEVMRRILLQEAFGVGSKRSGAGSFTMVGHVYGANPQSGEAFHIAGAGATFVLRTSDAVAPGPEKTDTGEKPKETTLWDRVLADVEGRPPAASAAQSKDLYDAGKVEALEDEILEQLGRFGGRIAGLAANEHITVIVVGGANRSTAAITPSGKRLSGWVDTNGSPGEQRTDAARLYFQYANAFGSGGRAPRTVLTIRVPVADLRRVADGSLTGADLRRQARIHAY